MQRSLPRSYWWFGGLLAASVVLEFTPLDRWVQDLCYDFSGRRWRVDENEPVGRALFYDWPKVVIGAAAVALITLAAGPSRWREALTARGWRTDRKALLVVLLTAALVPVFIGFLKKVSGVYCPIELSLYGGPAPYLRPFAYLVSGTDSAGHCWPAGHPSGAFGLLALTLLGTAPRVRTVLTGLALTLGWTMGLYQMLKGAHFLSHVTVTMLFAMAFTWLAARLIGPTAPKPARSPGTG
jgi:membrane-associated PAP2 superfamily phosphatase